MVHRRLGTAQNNSKKRTRETALIEKILAEHFPDFTPEYPPEAYRYSPASIRLRLVTNRFKGKNRGERYRMVAPLLKERLPEDTWQDLTLVVLLAPEDLEDSMANREFERPTPLHS